TPANTTSYTVVGKGANGCINSSTVTVKADYNMNALYLLPNSFTPNGDGVNDCFGIKYWGIVKELNFSIYNRFGERVFAGVAMGFAMLLLVKPVEGDHV
ncbi:MAG: gliding motility-associated C-terminal domain-containing protein, partial [Bacteroidota bacterium]|nr:gliding motility-associated C-terminal domain-containing protein [Bacteroidota bacterium]